MGIFEILNLRYEYEELTSDWSVGSSDIDSINWFIENGHKSNRLRNGFKRAKEIAHVIKEYHDGTKKTTTRVKVRTL